MGSNNLKGIFEDFQHSISLRGRRLRTRARPPLWNAECIEPLFARGTDFYLPFFRGLTHRSGRNATCFARETRRSAYKGETMGDLRSWIQRAAWHVGIAGVFYSDRLPIGSAACKRYCGHGCCAQNERHADGEKYGELH